MIRMVGRPGRERLGEESEDLMAEEGHPALRQGMSVVTADNQRVGEVREVFRDLGLVESFGKKGILPSRRDMTR